MTRSRFRKYDLARLLSTTEGYDICTALRGPDKSEGLLKSATTAVIRYKVGITENNPRFCLSYPDTKDFAEYRKSLGNEMSNSFYPNKYQQNHFLQHAYNAFKALGLKWDEVNN